MEDIRAGKNSYETGGFDGIGFDGIGFDGIGFVPGQGIWGIYSIMQLTKW